MRYAAVAKFNREQSLRAMWQALRARDFADQQRVENDAGVVGDLLNARYYGSARGQFISQDPSFLSVGDLNQFKSVTGQDQRTFLSDPQLANSYNYGRDNPITQKDPTGLAPLGTWFSQASDPTTAAAKQQLLANLQAGYQGMVAGAKVSGALVVSGAVAVANPAAVPYVLGGWVSAGSSAYEDYQNGMIDKSGNSYAGAFLLGAGQETRFIQSGGLLATLAKSTILTASASTFINNSFASSRSLVSNAAGTLAGRITQTAMSYSAGSAQRVLLTQLSQAVASLAVQVATLQAIAPSQSKTGK